MTPFVCARPCFASRSVLLPLLPLTSGCRSFFLSPALLGFDHDSHCLAFHFHPVLRRVARLPQSVASAFLSKAAREFWSSSTACTSVRRPRTTTTPCTASSTACPMGPLRSHSSGLNCLSDQLPPASDATMHREPRTLTCEGVLCHCTPSQPFSFSAPFLRVRSRYGTMSGSGMFLFFHAAGPQWCIGPSMDPTTALATASSGAPNPSLSSLRAVSFHPIICRLPQE